jgi:hydroxyacylglutathione hydrolase
MIVERFYTPGLAQVAYGVADPEQRVAAIIDPRRDVDVYLAWAAERGWRIVAILETHVHADFVSGAQELAAATGAPIFAGRLGATAFPHRPLDDGDIVPIGDLRLQALWTPGHTPEHIAYLVYDPSAGEQPIALFSGDVLFAGEIGRPDLLGAEQTEALVDQLYKTVSRRLAALSDDLVVYPGHGAGSPCGKKIGDAAHTTIGQEKRFNYAFQHADNAAFSRAILQGMPQPPHYYPLMKRINAEGPPLLASLPPSGPLSPEQVAARQDAGALLIDGRSPAAFAVEHIPESVSVALGPSFPIWAGWVIPEGREVIMILPADQQHDDALVELRRIGVDRVSGYLAGGIDVWKASGRPVVSLPELSIAELATRVGKPDKAIVVLDVRDPTEWAAGRIASSRNLSAGAIAAGARPTSGDDGPVAVICGSGYRSSVAGSILQGAGARNIVTIPGGMSAWSDAGLPVEVGLPEEEAQTVSTRMAGPWQGHGGPMAQEIDVADLVREVGQTPLQIVDVREPEEWAQGRIPGSIHLPMGEVAQRLHELDPRIPVVTVCRIGVRSLVSADELLLAGFTDVKSLAGGIVAWADAGQPLERGGWGDRVIG